MSAYSELKINYIALHKNAAAAAAAKSLQSCPTLCDPIDGSPPGSPVPGILQARTLEWVVISFSKDEAVVGKQTISHLRQAKWSQGTPKRKR